MTKTEFVAKLAASAHMSLLHADKALNAVLDSIEDGLYRDGRVSLPSLGIFDILARPARTGRHPATGADLHIPPTRTVRFKPAKKLKEILN